MSDDVQSMTGSMDMRISRKMTEGQGGVMRVYPGFKSQYKLLCKMGASAMLIVATVLALGVGSRMTNVETSATHQPVGPSQQCAKKYGELFDLAQLAKRDGKSSDIMVRELTVMSGRLNKCLLTAPAHVQVAGSDFSAAQGAHPQSGSQS
jgi:hypothetical protein